MDAARRRRGLSGDGDGIGIDVDSSEFDGDAARVSPALDAAQSVAVAAADVEDVNRPGDSDAEDERFKPIEIVGGSRGTID